ncbi:hypothetical protein [Sinorhizobium meliloti]|uniref:hypothetical protein n=1 Tax=Rhizobium meliloti TaxID=382 RepID=UPI003F176F8C
MTRSARHLIVVAWLVTLPVHAFGQSSIWLSLDTATGRQKPDPQSRYHVFSPPRYEIPTLPENESLTANAKIVDDIARVNTSVAFDFWLEGVSGGVFHADYGTIDWVGMNPDWDYVVHGRYSRNAENAGNFNYAMTGHRLLTHVYARLPLTDALRESAIGWTLRLGGGAYQIKSDIFEHGVLPKPWGKRTAYFEDIVDIRPIENGMRYDRFLQLEKVAQDVGVRLSPALFGFDVVGPPAEFPLLRQRLDSSELLDRLEREDEERRERATDQ